MLLENIRDRKLKQLYQMLTNSDFKGNFEEDYTLCLLYAMRCIDVCQNQGFLIEEKHYVDIAKEIIRIYDTSDQYNYENISIMSWTKALLDYMKKYSRSYRDIHRMNCFDLLNAVMEFIDPDMAS